MRALAVIPARYDSTRFPGKPLALVKGKPMIQRVFERASRSLGLDQVIIATDDERIQKACQAFGAPVVMTAADHPSGTDRVFEAASKMSDDFDLVLNLQGDEPLLHPSQVEGLLGLFADKTVGIATLATPILRSEELISSDVVKVVTDKNGKALYFSRQAIPYRRDEDIRMWLDKHTYLRHLGLYAFRYSTLEAVTKLKMSSLETCERLEQLRWLEAGHSIHVGRTAIPSYGVDTPEDLAQLEANWKEWGGE